MLMQKKIKKDTKQTFMSCGTVWEGASCVGCGVGCGVGCEVGCVVGCGATDIIKRILEN